MSSSTRGMPRSDGVWSMSLTRLGAHWKLPPPMSVIFTLGPPTTAPQGAAYSARRADYRRIDSEETVLEVRRIGVLGATGYTGRLVADELAARGLPHRLRGGNPGGRGAVEQGGVEEAFVVDTNDPGRLAAFCDGVDAVISTVGPFVQLGMPVVEAVVS